MFTIDRVQTVDLHCRHIRSLGLANDTCFNAKPVQYSRERLFWCAVAMRRLFYESHLYAFV